MIKVRFRKVKYSVQNIHALMKNPLIIDEVESALFHKDCQRFDEINIFTRQGDKDFIKICIVQEITQKILKA
jgi:hypothetical protein